MKRANPFAILILLTFGLLACSNPADSGEEHEEHIHGAVLTQDNQEIVRIEEGEITAGGIITVVAGQSSSLITIEFLEENGTKFHPEDPAFEVGWEITNPDIAAITQPSSDSKWSFEVQGKTAGTTPVTFQLWHTVDEGGHPDFETPQVTIEVTSESQ